MIVKEKAACLFTQKEYERCIEILNNLTVVKSSKDHIVTKELGLRAAMHEKDRARNHSTAEQSKKEEIFTYRTSCRLVEEGLIRELYELDTMKISKLSKNEARRGEGFCTDYKLFDNNSPYINKLKIDLRMIIHELLDREVCAWEGTFFNIFQKGSKSLPHAHLWSHDKKFDLYKHKYSLVYYLDVGDQNCEHPGILKIHDPELDILPKKGMIVIMPATQKHSSIYGGSKDRLMVGANFYAFKPLPTGNSPLRKPFNNTKEGHYNNEICNF